MKNTFYLLFLLISITSFSQEIVRPGDKYYSADNTQNRTDILRPSADAVKMWKDSGFIEMEVKLYQPTLVYRFPKVYPVIIRDTVLVGQELTQSFKDTTIWGWSKVRLNKLKQIVFTHRLSGGGYRSTHLKVLDTTIFRSCPQTDFCERDSMKFNIRYNFNGPYISEVSEEISDFKLEYFFERSQDINGTSTQTYANKLWHFYSRRSDTVEELLTLPFVFASDNPGNGIGDDGTENYTGEILRRHSQAFNTKYYQIQLLDPETGFRITMDIQNNEFK